MIRKKELKRNKFKSYTPKWDTWEGILSNSKNDITVEIWNTGQLKVPLGGMFNLKHKDAPPFKEKSTFVDVPVYLVKSVDNGMFLIDAGLDRSYMDNNLESVSGIFSRFIMLEGKKGVGQSIYKRITDKNISLSAMFFTHLHFDHTAGLMDIVPDFPLIVGKGAKPNDIPLLFRTKHFDHIAEVNEIDFSDAIEIPPFKQVLDIFGDNSIYAINTDGHTKGHVSYLINCTDGPILITGDQVYTEEQYLSGVGPGTYSENISLAQVYFDQIVEFKTLFPYTKLYMGHDVNYS